MIIKRENEIIEFWNWFKGIYNDFGTKFENSLLIETLDRRISSLGDYSWELGPGRKKDNMLVISPNGDIGKLPDTEFIISLSPNLTDWEFYSAKPKKESGLIFYYDIDAEYKIDAANWTYYLLKVDENYFDIVIIANDISKFPESDQQSIAEILLDNILGEKMRINSFQYIDVNHNIDEEYLGNTSSIKNLEDHLMYLAKK